MASSFLLRPWPRSDKKPNNIGDFVARINAERGFRDVTEAQLREDVKAKEEGRPENGSMEDESESEEEADAKQDKTAWTARQEFLRDIDVAHQCAMLCQDAVSLLLTKETPNSASTTLSPALRDLVGIGTLGASKHADSNVTQARIKDDTAVAIGWRIMGINSMVDSVVAAAEQLEKEIALETKYWADVLTVGENGWAILSMPRERYVLGVRFGFAEAAPEYRNISIASLLRNDDGTARLGHSLGTSWQRIRVVIERNGQVTGKSRLPKQTADNAPLEDRVLEARNTIFSQELWHELNREARTLLSLGVRADGKTITYDMNDKTKIIITLEDLGDTPDFPDDSADNKTAETCALGLYLLLIQAHRMNYARRSQAVQPERGPNTPPYTILRFFISRTKYHVACDTLTFFLTGLITTLKRAGIATANFTKTINPLNLQMQMQASQSRRMSRSEALMQSLVQNLEVMSHITLTPEAQIQVHGRSFISPTTNTQFQIKLPNASPASPAAPRDQSQTSPNPLEEAYPPHQNPYPDVIEVMQYICYATVRAVTDKFSNVVAERLGKDDIDWAETVNGPAITDRDEREARFEISSLTSPILSLTLSSPNPNTEAGRYTWAPGEASNAEDILVRFFGQ